MKTVKQVAITILSVSLVSLLTACGNTKSQTNATPVGSVTTTGLKPLAYCNTASDSTMAFNTAVVVDQSGQINPDWIKLKFSFISANITKSGNTVRIYKWRVTNLQQAILDQTPLNVATYDFTSGQSTSQLTSSFPAEQLNGQYGLYIQLNDPSMVYQVIKIVVYDSAGTVIANTNSLIPAFNANPADYAINSDGSARSASLLQLHALYGKSTGYVGDQYKQYFDRFCF